MLKSAQGSDLVLPGGTTVPRLPVLDKTVSYSTLERDAKGGSPKKRWPAYDPVSSGGVGGAKGSRVPGAKSRKTTEGGRPGSSEERGDIRTSNDVIEYYVKNGHGAEIKLFHCNKPSYTDRFQPYELVVVSREKANLEHFTLSASGVVHIQNGMQAEFTSLGDWMRDQSIFNLLRQMKFFKYFLVTKMFYMWRSSVRHKLYMQVREKLTRKLFMAKETFCSAMLEMRSLITDITDTPLSLLTNNHLYNLEEFADQQVQHRSQKAAPQIEAFVERMQRVLERVAREVVTQERHYRASVEKELGDKCGFTLLPGRAGKTKSMAATKLEKIERARTYKRVAEEAKMLGALIRLADHMMVEALVSLTIGTAEEMLRLFSNPNKGKGIFQTTVSFATEGIQFVPRETEVKRIVNHNVLEGMLSTVNGIPRLLFMRSFTVFFEDRVTGPSPMQIIQTTDRYAELKRDLDGVITTSFDQAAEYGRIFEDYRAIYDFGESWNVDDYERDPRTVAQFRKDMAVQREWKNDVERIKLQNVIGILNVDSRAMRSSLGVITSKTLEAMKALLLVAARTECSKAVESFQKRVRALSDRPEALDNFAVLLDNHDEMTGNKRAVLAESLVVDEMYDMLTSYEMKIPMKDQVGLDDLHEAVSAFTSSLEDGTDFIDDKKAGMVTTLDKDIVEMNEALLSLLAELHSGIYVVPESNPKQVLRELAKVCSTLDGLSAKSVTYRKYQSLFGLQQDDFSNLSLTQKEYDTRLTIWKALHDWEDNTDTWMNGSVGDLNLESTNEVVEETARQSHRLLKANKDDRVVYRFKDEIDSFKKYMPLLQELANPALQPRHWEQVFQVVQKPYHQDVTFSINDLIEYGMMDHLEALENISMIASKEFSLFNTLKKMEDEWVGQEFNCMPYKETGTFILGGTDEIQNILDDQIVKVQAMSASPFAKPFKDRVTDLERSLSTLQDLLDNWLKCQGTWLYLEPIFSSEDIVKQMPAEGEKFRFVDNSWRDLMQLTTETPDVLNAAKDSDQLEELIECNHTLDLIQKGLAAYLEKKRLFFPRFFFLSNDEMLEILSETKDPTRVQPHLKKCFEGINRLTFTKDLVITDMVSVEGEEIPMKNKIEPQKANGAVEKWLLEVEGAMFESVHDVTGRGIDAYAKTDRKDWVISWPGMVVLVVTAMYWTQEVTAALQAGTTKEYEEKLTNDLLDIVHMVRGELSSMQRRTLGALVVMDVHARDVVSKLVSEQISSDSAFDWQAQLRTYWEEDTNGERGNTAMMRIMNAEVEYGYEYLGNSSRLVITPLTDRCYRTLMGAIHMTLGGAPEGPAGTGKTETTKDLAKALARQCVVFNCSDSLDYIAMGKFFKGLASSGAWACFDEFNRIDLEVLSVVAQQVLDIQRAIGARVKSFVFEGTEISLKYSAWCAITMNPGYAGRAELPDNLKALFRTVAMMVPDYAMIAEIILFSNGYLEARDCSKKVVQCYKLCSEQLSSQDHYDYGMRAVMAVLRAAANLKRRYPDQDEKVLMLRSIIDVNLCKFLSHDVPLFQGIISDLFPGVKLPKADYDNMEDAMKIACKDTNLQPTPYFFRKTIELYEMIVVRHGLMIVGEPFAGKTCMYKTLARALGIMTEKGIEGTSKVDIISINPKSITMGQLYGMFDPVTHEWTDGVLAVKFRQFASSTTDTRKWLLLDGPVDAIWIENMNTVLDDNKKLCLNSGEIIAMNNQTNMIFEVMDLAVASPATVSRCGMVYVEPTQLGWRPIMDSWVATLPPSVLNDNRDHIIGLFDYFVPLCLKLVRKEIREAFPSSDTNIVKTLTNIFSSMCDIHREEESEESPASPKKASSSGPKDLRAFVDCSFIFALTWSIGATAAAPEGRKRFSDFLLEAFNNDLNKYQTMLGEASINCDEVKCPVPLERLPAKTDLSFHSWSYNPEKEEWTPWDSLIEGGDIPADAKFRDIIIQTSDSVRYTWLLRDAVTHQKPSLFVGPTGTGKTAYILKYLNSLPLEKYAPPILVSFSARTTANTTQYMIDAKLDKRRKGFYGPPVGKEVVIFVDDLNMPQLEKYGAQPPIELLRQYMDHGGWYDNSTGEWIFRNMMDCLFVCAMGQPGGGRNHITPRFSRHYNVVSVTDLEDQTLSSIFKSLLHFFLKTDNFPNEVVKLEDAVISSTLDIYRTSIDHLLPTPTKSHYTFNLRDFARVIQGVTLMRSKTLVATNDVCKGYVRLWSHEIMRVFGDRLTEHKDREWFLNYLKGVVQKNFGEDMDEIFAHLGRGQGESVGVEEFRKCFYGDYMSPENVDRETEPGKLFYEEVKDVPALMLRMEEYLSDYNALSKSPMNLAIFLYAMEHISRICRCLKQPGAHVMCAGVGGSGRQSLSRLATFICSMKCFQIAVSKSYTTVEWHEDLKKFCRTAGAEGNQCVFLFSDTQIKEEGFVEDINNLLNSGEVPNLFPYDERNAVQEQCRVQAKKEGLNLETPAELWNYFVDRTKRNLHIVLCLSPIGDAFRERLRQFPSLVNCCTIDWFQAWPNDALEAVANKFLAEVDLEEQQRKDLMEICKIFHQSVAEASEKFKAETRRINYVTPTSYLELLTLFARLLQEKRGTVMTAKKRYEVGLEKLNFTAEQVAIMQQELIDLKPNLIKTVGETEELLKVVAREKTEVVEPKAAIVDEEVKEAEKKGAAANAIKEECEAELAEAIPALEAALAALDTIKAADIKLIQSFKNPPATIKVVLEAVCVLMGEKPARINDPGGSGKKIDDYWGPSLNLLGQKGFVDTLKSYDKDNIPDKIISRIRKDFTSDENFTPANAAKASSAAEGLCKWVCAMDTYDRVAKVVAPKKASLAEAEAEYNTVMAGLQVKQAELKELQEKLAGLEQQLKDSMVKKEQLENDVDICTQKLERAEKLIGGLGGEKDRWGEAAKNLNEVYNNLTGDMLISAGVIGYLGAFTMTFRDQLTGAWVKNCKQYNIPSSKKFSLTSSLGEPVKIREWGIAGLPNDSFSIDNGIMVANARRWPLMIDPQNQANKWVKNMEKANNLQVIKLTDPDYLRTLENAIQFGLPVLLENVEEELDPSLEPLLLKQIFKQGGVNCIQLGESVIEFSSDFRFYIITAMRNPHYLPETAVKVTLLNFMITIDGLSDQLLGVVVAEERPELEEQRQELVIATAENKKRLKDIEDKILHVLSSSEGNILEDASAIQILSEAKVVSNEIEDKQAVADKTQKEIEATRGEYVTCGLYNAKLFFCIADIGNIDPMYQYSLSWFIKLFIRGIHDSDKDENVAQRLVNINEFFTYSLYTNVCRSLFVKDKLLFAFLLDVLILQGKGDVTDLQYKFFLTGMSGGVEDATPNPATDWLAAKSWTEICQLKNVSSSFKDIVSDFSGLQTEFKSIYDCSDPFNEDFPGKYKDIPGFDKLLLVRCLRPDKVVLGVQSFISGTIGTKYTEPPAFDLNVSFKESGVTAPLLFVLSPGSDPTAALLQFAEAMGVGDKIKSISMGQGQGPKAARLIEEAVKTGEWVVLQNCHLAASWMPALEKICEGIKPETCDPEFRLWMTSLPSPMFPITILQNAVKMTNEPPTGMRANLKRSYNTDPIANDDFFTKSTKGEAFRSLIFGLCFMHAFMQERRKFGPIGWNIPYSFDDSDLRISARQIFQYVEQNDEVPFAALQYAVGECNYGGRVTDDKDRRLLMTLQNMVFQKKLFEPDFKLSASGLYRVPKGERREDHLEFINSLPMAALPEAYGLHANADISKDLNDTKLLFNTLIIVGGSSSSGDDGQEDMVSDLCKNVLENLPPNFDIEAATLKFPVKYEESMNQVLCQEMLRYNGLLTVVRESLQSLGKAVAGLIVMSASLETVFNAMVLGAVPELWKGKSFPSLKSLGSYVNDLMKRLSMFASWYESGQPTTFWLPGFFFIPSFTTAALQNFARKQTLAIDKVAFTFEMLDGGKDDYPEAPKDGIYVHGLFLEGCSWDRQRRLLCESTPKVLYADAPTMWLRPTKVEDLLEEQTYKCPVYRTADRRGVLATTGHSTNFLMMMDMPTDQSEEHWTMQGVCMLCSLTD